MRYEKSPQWSDDPTSSPSEATRLRILFLHQRLFRTSTLWSTMLTCLKSSNFGLLSIIVAWLLKRTLLLLLIYFFHYHYFLLKSLLSDWPSTWYKDTYVSLRNSKLYHCFIYISRLSVFCSSSPATSSLASSSLLTSPQRRTDERTYPFAQLTNKSMYKRWVTLGYPKCELTEQYRTVPAISDTISTIWYKGSVVSMVDPANRPNYAKAIQSHHRLDWDQRRIDQDGLLKLWTNIAPPVAPNIVCPCQLSGHSCCHQNRPSRSLTVSRKSVHSRKSVLSI